MQLIESGGECTDERHVVLFENHAVCLAFLQSLPNYADFKWDDSDKSEPGKLLPIQENLAC